MRQKKFFDQWMYRFLENQLVVALRNGFIHMMPLILVGSIAVLVNNMPLQAFQSFMTNQFGEDWKRFTQYIYDGTIQIMAIGMLVSISYTITTLSKAYQQNKISPILPPLVSLGCLIAFMLPVSMDQFSLEWFGALGLFLAIIVSIIATYLFLWLYQHRLFKIHTFHDEANKSLHHALNSIEPTLITFAVFAAIRLVTLKLGIQSIHAAIYQLFQDLAIRNSNYLLTGLLFNVFSHLFWFFGLHGNNILEPLAQEMFVPALEANAAAVAAGGYPAEIITKPFFDIFVYLGGSGASLCLISAILLTNRKNNTFQLAKISSVFSLFNINEMLIYGLPVVLNPIYFIPFLLTPCILTLVTYVTMRLGLVPYVMQEATWTTPILFGGYVVTGSVSGSVLQAVNLAIGTVIYVPFVKYAQRHKEKENLTSLNKLMDEVHYIADEPPRYLLNRSDAIGDLGRLLAEDLKEDIDHNELVLVYQPQVNSSGLVVGAEALLRWPHKKFGFIPPPIAIMIAEEARLHHRLGDWVIHQSVRQLAQWKKNEELRTVLGEDFALSINISPSQIQTNHLTETLQKALQKFDILPERIKLELTENIALDNSQHTKMMLEAIKQMGIKLSIDDFGMGHSSLMYIRIFEVDTIKLDGALTKDVLSDANTKDIIRAIVNLCKSMGMTTVAEFVETEEQAKMLFDLGCDWMQGYYYSKPLNPEEFARFSIETNQSALKAFEKDLL